MSTAGLPGVEVSVKTPAGAYSRMRLHVAGSRVYELVVFAGDPHLLRDRDAEAFLGSFRPTS